MVAYDRQKMKSLPRLSSEKPYRTNDVVAALNDDARNVTTVVQVRPEA